MTRLPLHARARAGLQARLAGPGPSLHVVRGPEGAGGSTLVRDALPPGRRVVTYAAPPVADADHRSLLSARLARVLSLPPEAASDEGLPARAWEDLLEDVRRSLDASHEPLILVLDDVHHVLAARSRLPELLAGFWAGVRAHALPLHLVLAGRGAGGLSSLVEEGPLAAVVETDLALGPVGYREALAAFAPWEPRERLLAWSVFGGFPAALRLVDASASLASNVRRLVLDPGGPLFRHGSALLESSLQSPARYGSVLRALALGGREWGALVEAVPAFGSAGQLAPYLARLEALGWIEVERSVDASPRSRSQRYRIVDPLLAFWLRFVAPHRAEIDAGGGGEVWSRIVRPGLDDHMELHFPPLCREWMRLHAGERLPGRAREVGGLWGSGYDLEVGGTLRTGAAFYGRCRWGGPPAGVPDLDEVERALATTRYGFGREARLRIVFSGAGADGALQRRSARDPQVVVVGPEELVGP